MRAGAANPPIAGIYTADPAVLVDNGRLYLYTGHDEAPPDQPGYRMHDWRLYFGLVRDGTVVSTGLNENGQCNVRTWRLKLPDG
jgi:hypothetical protein